MKDKDAINKIRKVRKSLKSSQIVINEIITFPKQCHEIIFFSYRGTQYEYRDNTEQPNGAWIEKRECNHSKHPAC